MKFQLFLTESYNLNCSYRGCAHKIHSLNDVWILGV
jgi:hypothetical protein